MRAAGGLVMSWLVMTLGGCVVTPCTDAVRDVRPRTEEAAAAPAAPVALHALGAVRTPDGAHHVLVRCSDGALRRLVVEQAPTPAWRLEASGALPVGVPVTCRPGALAPAGDPAAGVLTLERGEVRLTPPDRPAVVLSHVPTLPPPRPAPGGPLGPAQGAQALLVPLALVVDLTLSAALTAGSVAALPLAPFGAALFAR